MFLWFANDEDNIKLEEYLRQLVQKMNEYHGENWISYNSENDC